MQAATPCFNLETFTPLIAYTCSVSVSQFAEQLKPISELQCTCIRERSYLVGAKSQSNSKYYNLSGEKRVLSARTKREHERPLKLREHERPRLRKVNTCKSLYKAYSKRTPRLRTPHTFYRHI